MLSEINATLVEVLEVNGQPLEEYVLWVILRHLVKTLSQLEDDLPYFRISAYHVLLFPSGCLKINCDKKIDSFIESPAMSEQLRNVALIILWCAEYNLDRSLPLNISSGLQTLLTTMCDQQEICTVDHVQEICNHQLNAKPCDDALVISKLCASILGSNEELALGDLNESKSSYTSEDASVSLYETSGSFSDSSSMDSRMGCFFGKTYMTSLSQAQGKDFSMRDRSSKDSWRKTKKEYGSDMHQREKKKMEKRHSASFLSTEPFKSILKVDEKVKTVHIKSENETARSTTVAVSFVNHAKISIVVENPATTTILDLLQTSLVTFLPKIEDENVLKHFSLATWIDSDYHFFDNSTHLGQVFQQFPSSMNDVFCLRILYFPPDTNVTSPILLSTMYIQLRADITDERVTSSHDDALALAALALQCEFGDYKPEYGCGYFVGEEFLSPHVVSQLGLSYIRSELPALHRQLAGIGKKEARLLFLRKAQRLDEYGMNFHKAYRLKTCKEENATWIGVGPRGITIFDMRGNFNRIKRHTFQWAELKKIAFNNRKIVLTKLTPEVKFKFYQPETTRAKYVVTVIGKLHKFYSEHSSPSQFSPLALFDDITQLSSTLNSSLITQASPNLDAHEGETSLNKPPSPWTYNNPKFRRNKQVLRRHSNISSASSVDTEPTELIEHLDNRDFKPISNIDVHQRPRKKSSNGESLRPSESDTVDLTVKRLESILAQSTSSTLHSSVPGSSKEQPLSDFIQAKAPNNAQKPTTTEQVVSPTPLPRTKHKAKIIAQHHAMDNSLSKKNMRGDDVHLAARSFYRSSLGDDTLVPPCVEKLNETLKTIQSDAASS